MKRERHLRVLAGLFAGLSFLGLVALGVLLLSDLLVSVTLDEIGAAVLQLSPARVLLSEAAVYLVLNVIASRTLFRRRARARSYVLGVRIFNLVNSPLRTSLGAYTILGLSGEEARAAPSA